MTPRLSGQTSAFGGVFFVSKSILGIEGQNKLKKNLECYPKSLGATLEYSIDKSKDSKFSMYVGKDELYVTSS